MAIALLDGSADALGMWAYLTAVAAAKGAQRAGKAGTAHGVIRRSSLHSAESAIWQAFDRLSDAEMLPDDGRRKSDRIVSARLHLEWTAQNAARLLQF